MKKLVIVFILPFFLGSCTLDNIKYFSNKFIGSDKNMALDSANETDNSSKNETNSGLIVEEGSETGSNDNQVEEKEQEDSTKVLSIEEQYCKSKGGKVADEICYVTDDVGLLKCNVNVFYLDMCRDKSAKIKNGVVVSIPGYAKKAQLSKQTGEATTKIEVTDTSNSEKTDNLYKNSSSEEKKVENIENKQSIDTKKSDKEENKKKMSEKKLGNGFIFKEDDSSKYLYLNDKMITKLSKSSKIMMNGSKGKTDDNIFSFSVYSNKSDTSPSKTLYVNMNTKTLSETSNSKIDTQTGDTSETKVIIKTDNLSKKTEIDNTSMVNTKSGKSGTYFISGGDLKIKTGTGYVKTIFSPQGSGRIYDYELLVNKQVKVFYFTGSDNQKEEKIINLP